MEKILSEPLPRGTPKITEISLGGTSVKVRTEATPASLKQIRDLVNSKFDEFSENVSKGMSGHQMAVLVAFNLAEELLREQEKMRLLKRRVTDSTERLVKRVEAHLGNLSGRSS
jgi:cell division protein ZapA (FtsZ GTPase activity inhibitor)